MGRFLAWGPWSPALVFLASAAESAGFVGLFVPGELATFFGAALAGVSGIPLWIVAVAAVTGSITGDSIGYWMGKRFGPAMLEHRLLKKAKPALERATRFLDAKGKWALVAARFMPMIRTLTPVAAGAGGLRFRQFIVGDGIGALLWGVMIATIGHWAGFRWEAIEGGVRQGSLLLAVIGVSLGAVIWIMRWVADHPSKVRSVLARAVERPIIGPLLRLGVAADGQPRPFLKLLPHTVSAIVSIGSVALLAAPGLVFAEAHVLDFFGRQLTPEFASSLERVAAVLPLLLIGIVVVGAAACWATGKTRDARLVSTSVMISLAVAALIWSTLRRETAQILLGLPASSPFPDFHVAGFTAFLFAVVWPWTSSWGDAVRRLGLAFTTASLVTLTLIAGHAVFPIDGVAGLALGVAAVFAAGMWLDPRIRTHLRTTPPPSQAAGAAPEPV